MVVSSTYGLVRRSHYQCVNLYLIYNKQIVNYFLITGQADVILANSKFTARVFKAYFPSITQNPSVIYPGINISAYEAKVDLSDLDVSSVAR